MSNLFVPRPREEIEKRKSTVDEYYELSPAKRSKTLLSHTAKHAVKDPVFDKAIDTLEKQFGLKALADFECLNSQEIALGLGLPKEVGTHIAKKLHKAGVKWFSDIQKDLEDLKREQNRHHKKKNGHENGKSNHHDNNNSSHATPALTVASTPHKEILETSTNKNNMSDALIEEIEQESTISHQEISETTAPVVTKDTSSESEANPDYFAMELKSISFDDERKNHRTAFKVFDVAGFKTIGDFSKKTLNDLRTLPQPKGMPPLTYKMVDHFVRDMRANGLVLAQDPKDMKDKQYEKGHAFFIRDYIAPDLDDTSIDQSLEMNEHHEDQSLDNNSMTPKIAEEISSASDAASQQEQIATLDPQKNEEGSTMNDKAHAQEIPASSGDTVSPDYYKMELRSFKLTSTMPGYLQKLENAGVKTLGDVSKKTRQQIKEIGNVRGDTFSKFEELLSPGGVVFKDDMPETIKAQNEKGDAYYKNDYHPENMRPRRSRSQQPPQNNQNDDPVVLQKTIELLKVNAEDLFEYSIKDLLAQNKIETTSALNKIADKIEFDCQYPFEIALLSSETWQERGYEPSALNAELAKIEIRKEDKMVANMLHLGLYDETKVVVQKDKEDRDKLEKFNELAQAKKERLLSILKPAQP